MGLQKPLFKPAIDAGNSITSGLVFDCPFYEGFSTITLDIVGSNNGALTGGPPTWKSVTGFGYYLDFASSTDLDTFTVGNSVKQLTTQTYECYFNLRTAAVSSRRIFHKANNNGDTYFQLGQEDNQSTVMQIHTLNATTNGAWTFTHNGLNTWQHVVVTYDNTNNANNPVVYLNGVSVSVTRVTSPVGAMATDDNYLAIGNRADLVRAWDGGIMYGRIWNRILSSTEAGLLYQNPWRIYLPIQTTNHQFATSGNGMSVTEKIR